MSKSSMYLTVAAICLALSYPRTGIDWWMFGLGTLWFIGGIGRFVREIREQTED